MVIGSAIVAVGVLGQGIIVVTMEFAPDRTSGLQSAFIGFGVLLLLTLPIVLTIPDPTRAQPRREDDEAAAQASPAITTPFGSR